MPEHSFFQEIQEDLKRQKLETLWKKYGFWIVVTALGLVVATASATAYRSWRAVHNQEVTAELLTVTQGDLSAGDILDGLEGFSKSHEGADLAAMALLRAGHTAWSRGDAEKAVALFDRVGTNKGVDLPFRQLGTLLSVQAQLDEGDPAVLSARLTPLLATTMPWRFSAKEALAYVALRADDKDKAKQIFSELAKDPETPSSLSARASVILHAWD